MEEKVSEIDSYLFYGKRIFKDKFLLL